MYVKLKGELTKDTVDKLDRKVTMKIKKMDCCDLIYNVSDLKVIDYKGVNKLFYNYEIVNEKNGKVLLYGNNLNISKLLKKSRLLNYICELKN